MGPASFDASEIVAAGMADEKIDEAARGLAAAINQGFAAAGPGVDYLAWLGDDDLLRPGALTRTEQFLDAHPRSSAVYGRCDYIDEHGTKVWAMPTGWWAAPLLRVGPQLVPQPGSLFRRGVVERVGLLRTDLGWAFDFDFLIRLSKAGRLSYLDVLRPTSHGTPTRCRCAGGPTRYVRRAWCAGRTCRRGSGRCPACGNSRAVGHAARRWPGAHRIVP